MRKYFTAEQVVGQFRTGHDADCLPQNKYRNNEHDGAI